MTDEEPSPSAGQPGRARIARHAGRSRFVLGDADARVQMEKFGVIREQIEHDFLLSHVLEALAPFAEHFVFYGGTALSRTILDGLRLSEDIDLLSVGPRKPVAGILDDAIRRGLERGFGQIAAEPSLVSALRDTDACIYRVGTVDLKIQLGDGRDYTPLPTMMSTVRQRYFGLDDIELATYTPDAFVVAKTTAWMDATRNAPRDLYDLWALAQAGCIDAQAAFTYKKFGPTGAFPALASFPASAPTGDEWVGSLSHQCVPRVGPAEAHARVIAAWESAVSAARVAATV